MMNLLIEKFCFEDFIGIFDISLDCDKIIEYYEYLKSCGCEIGTPQHQKDFRKDTTIYLHELNIAYRNDYLAEYNFISRECLLLYLEKYNFTKIDYLQQSQCKLQKTIPGGGYHVWHCENSGHDGVARGLVTLLYLNDILDGGETEFLFLSKRIKPKKGRFLIFPAGFTHFHRGNPPLTKEKYIATSWIEYK